MAINYTPEQEKCVECLIGPVDVSAGAGSGKTFTLTQRIARALVQPNTGVDDIDQICAITFTEKAAAELKGRVRSTLRAEGLFQQAGKVDDAWISTIHGMCSRILHASALDLGLDPRFEVLDEKDAEDLLDQSIDQVLQQRKLMGSGDYADLLREYPFKAFANEPCLSGLLRQVISTASGMPGGLDQLVVCRKHVAPSVLAKRLMLAFEDLSQAYADLKPGKNNDLAREQVDAGLKALGAYVCAGRADLEGLMEALDGCPVVRKCGNASQKEVCDHCRDVHNDVLAQVAMLRGGALLDQLMGLAREADRVFTQAKRQRAQLDNNDLVKETLRALEMPQIHDRYKDRFRLVMVDEFQDTDSMQIAIVKHLAGPNMRYLCTVGDAQQSIYAFRGADVAVYREHQRSLDDPQLSQEGAQPSKLMLSRNFRSHGDVLAFVKAVCSQPQVFGGSFLDLSAVYDGAKYAASEPRVQLELVYTPVGMKAKEEDRRQVQARRIADYFRRMHEGGHALSEMVLLLGSTTSADLYAQAVRDQGFDCIIAGGSLFSRAPEVKTAAVILGALANPRDGELIFQALSSPAFALSADDLLQLATVVDPHTQRIGRRSLASGIYQLARDVREGEQVSPALKHAVAVMEKALGSMRLQSVHQVLLGVLLDSGWLARLQEQGAEGAAVMGNLMKAVRMVRQLEEESTLGPVSIASRFMDAVDAGMKESPGALNAQGQDAVRIMTIHASKGLEFPIVALAEFDRNPQDSALVIHRVEGTAFASLRPASRKVAGKDGLESKALKAVAQNLEIWRDGPATAAELQSADGATFRGLLTREAQKAAREETQRLFYVGATRAKEALCVFMSVKDSRDNPDGPYKGLVGNIRSALFGKGEFPQQTQDVEYGGSEPARFTVSLVDAQGKEEAADAVDSGASQKGAAALGSAEAPEVVADQASAAAADAAADADDARVAVGSQAAAPAFEQVALPAVMPLQLPEVRLGEARASGLFSYSSISVAGHAEGADAAFGAVEVPTAGLAPDSETSPDPDSDSAPAPLLALEVVDAAAEDVDSPSAFAPAPTFDQDKATSFGSALHRLCQLAAIAGPQAARAQIDSACRTYGVAGRERLAAALERWLGSATYARSQRYASVQPELPFCLQLFHTDRSGTHQGVLQGEIDLLCCGAADGQPDAPVLVVDYKTGGFADETPQQLQEKHALQAQCYALAVLSGGHKRVELVFARVEQGDPAGSDTLQTIRYAFGQEDVPELQRIVTTQAIKAGAL